MRGAIESMALREIRVDDGNERLCRVLTADGEQLPGFIIADPYRAVKYGFVYAEFPGLTFAGVSANGKLYEPRLVDAIINSLDLRVGKDGEITDYENKLPMRMPTEMAIPNIRDALEDLTERNIPVADFI